MGRAVTTSARRENETSNVCGIVHDVLYKEREGLDNTTVKCQHKKRKRATSGSDDFWLKLATRRLLKRGSDLVQLCPSFTQSFMQLSHRIQPCFLWNVINQSDGTHLQYSTVTYSTTYRTRCHVVEISGKTGQHGPITHLPLVGRRVAIMLYRV